MSVFHPFPGQFGEYCRIIQFLVWQLRCTKGFQRVLKMHSTGAITTRLYLEQVTKEIQQDAQCTMLHYWYNRDTEHHRQHSYIHSPEERKRKEGMVWGPGRRCVHYIYSGYSPATDDAMQCEQNWFYDDDQLLRRR